MAEAAKEKLLEVEEVRQHIEELRTKVGEMADYIRIDERRKKLAELEEQQASGDFWNDQNKAREVIAATNSERAYVVPYDSLVKTVEDAAVMLELAEMEEGKETETMRSAVRLSGDLSLSVQKEIFSLLECEKRVGLCLNDSLLMSPSKSVTAFARPAAGASRRQQTKCLSCSRQDCEFRGNL